LSALIFLSMVLTAGTVRGQTDIADVFNRVLKRKKPADTTAKPAGSLVLLPTIGYTPSTGFQFGADVSGTRYFGNPETTTLSVFDAYAALSTGGMAILQIKHNIYSSGNTWNLQGNWNLGKTVMLDHGIGTTGTDEGLFTLRYRFLNLNENAYKELFDHFYAGVGISFNYYTKIDNQSQDSAHPESFNAAYSVKNSYSPDSYFANGMLLNFQYNTRDQPYRPYKGIYLNVLLRSNRTWMGSERNAVQLRTELRKYWSLSAKNPEHVLAYWLWGSYLLNGSIPYLELPGTGSDNDQRTGRGYTIGRFKGPSFMINEVEYRYPLTRNKLISGVAFFNAETASDQSGTKLFQHLEPGMGAGLRILFNKSTRTNLCLDYGFGNYHSKGVFVGLNEVF